MKLTRKRGDTSNILQVFVQDSSSTTGAGLAGLAFNTSGLTAYYHRDVDTTATAITLATMTVGTFTSSGFKEIDATNMPGWYQFCPPDTALAATSTPHSVGFHLKGATNMAPLPIEVQLIAADLEDTVRLGLTALPNAAAAASGGLFTRGTGAGQINQDANGRVDVNVVALLNTAWLTPGTAGTPDVNVKLWNALSTVALPLVPTTAGRTLDVSATGEAGVDWANVGGAASVNNLTNTTVLSAGSVVGAVGSVGAGGIATTSFAGGAINRAALAADTGLQPIRSNTAQAGGATTITLDASASAVDSFYNNDIVYITGGTGIGQARFVSAYVGATKVATVAAWATNPDNTSTFAILPFDAVAGASAPTVAQIATGVWQDTTAGDFTTAGSIGKSLFTSGAVPGAAGGHFIAGTNTATTVAITGNITGNLSGSVGSVTGAVGSVTGLTASDVGAIKVKTDNLPAAPAAVSDIPTANANADALLDRSAGVETGVTPRQALRLTAAVLGAKLSGAGTGTEIFRNAVADAKDRVTATVDSSGNRTAITYDLT